MKKTILFISLFLIAACDSGKEPASSADSSTSVEGSTDFNLTEIAEGVFVHQGVHVEVDHEDHADIANIGFIVGDECVAVIDTGGSIENGLKLRKLIKTKTDKQICYVINTHVHFDHVLGNHAFKQDNPKYVGHINLADALLQNREFFLEAFTADLGENATVENIVGPEILVEDTMEIDLGNRKLLLTAHPKAHTTTDLSILDQKTNILWTGDLVFMERVPVIDGGLKSWFTVMEGMNKHEYKLVVPGHGPSSAAWPEAMEPQQQYFKVLIDETRQAIADGIFLGDALTKVAQSEKDNWVLFESLNQRAVSRAYQELEWE
ncbi:MAG: quinoprotein relay system zinc metallohydrolase 2 [Gammaproteobacteria bacterium]